MQWRARGNDTAPGDPPVEAGKAPRRRPRVPRKGLHRGSGLGEDWAGLISACRELLQGSALAVSKPGDDWSPGTQVTDSRDCGRGIWRTGSPMRDRGRGRDGSLLDQQDTAPTAPWGLGSAALGAQQDRTQRWETEMGRMYVLREAGARAGGQPPRGVHQVRGRGAGGSRRRGLSSACRGWEQGSSLAPLHSVVLGGSQGMPCLAGPSTHRAPDTPVLGLQLTRHLLVKALQLLSGKSCSVPYQQRWR